MKLKKYNQILEEIDPRDWGQEDDDELFGRPYYSSNKNMNYREDENSWMNDKLNDDEDDWDDWDGDNRYGHGPSKDDDDDIDSDDMSHLLYLLRSMFNNSGIENVYVENKKMDISISVEMRRRERLKDIIKVFEVSNKLKRDILAQYDSEFEMWETKDGRPMLVFNFYYDEGLYDDEAPF